MTHSAMCNIVWFRQDNPTRRPDGVPGIIGKLLLLSYKNDFLGFECNMLYGN